LSTTRRPLLNPSLLFSKKLFIILFLNVIVCIIISCSPSKRFTNEDDTKTNKVLNSEIKSTSEVRVLLEENPSAGFLTIDNEVYLFQEGKKIALIRNGNTIQCYNENYTLKLIVQDKKFEGEYFKLVPADNSFVQLNGKKYKGEIFIYPAGLTVGVVNNLSIEDYVKGVLTKEMPVGTGEQNLEALKALAVCVRTYAINRMKEGNNLFDLFKDTRDQVYGGLDAEHPLSNRAVDETKNLILKYDGEPAIIYYHSTCGGATESAQNVFTQENIPYLESIKDGDPPNCTISNRFSWEEDYSEEVFVQRLIDANLLDEGNYSIEDININSRFESGRVNELEILIRNKSGSESSVKIYGNSIRNIIKTSDGSMSLWSTLFDIARSNSKIIAKGKGYGHGVGLCQWGAIGLSRDGSSYKQILEHYYPGTELGEIDD
jgi:stage II sporulation protein D (peptidoglycan lytic transglycosylase)